MTGSAPTTCGATDQVTSSTGGPAGAAPTTGAVSPFAHVAAVPATVNGARFDPATLTGKPVVLWFWAPWCTICRSEAPAVNKVAADFAGRVDMRA